MDLQGLGQEFAALTGEPNPFPVPRPPAPVPPKPDPAVVLEQAAGLIRTVAASVEKDVTELLAFLASHNL